MDIRQKMANALGKPLGGDGSVLDGVERMVADGTEGHPLRDPVELFGGEDPSVREQVESGAVTMDTTDAAYDRREIVRKAIIQAYRERRRFGDGHDDAVIAAMHEVRACSEDQARAWIAEDDPSTASAPESGRWAFDETVAAAFDDMLARSIPNYEDMRRFVTEAAAFFVGQVGVVAPNVVALGASRGSDLEPIVDKVGARARYVALEIAEPMLEALEDRFRDYVKAGVLRIERRDLRRDAPLPGMAAVVLSVLTLQFVPIEYRTQLLGRVHDALLPGGAFLLVEKVMGQTAESDRLMRRLYWDLKQRNGYTEEAVERKAASLEGVLVPLTARFNEELLRGAGFADPECVWAWGPFRGWLAVKR